MKKTEVKQNENIERNEELQEIMALWLLTSKAKNEYLFGTARETNGTEDSFPVTGFFNKKKKNDKEPDIRIYESVAEGDDLGECVVSLWNATSKAGSVYATGRDNEDRRVVAFFGNKNENKRPYLRVYYSNKED